MDLNLRDIKSLNNLYYSIFNRLQNSMKLQKNKNKQNKFHKKTKNKKKIKKWKIMQIFKKINDLIFNQINFIFY